MIEAQLTRFKVQSNCRLLQIKFMYSRFEPVVKTIAIDSITAYQNYISPNKGFSCPHRLVHGGVSCSDYVKKMLTSQSLVAAVSSSINRFQDCAIASRTLKTTGTNADFRCIVIPCCVPL